MLLGSPYGNCLATGSINLDKTGSISLAFLGPQDHSTIGQSMLLSSYPLIHTNIHVRNGSNLNKYFCSYENEVPADTSDTAAVYAHAHAHILCLLQVEARGRTDTNCLY